ncbi:hypothetical protein CCUS01_14399 [Colletotrichum cuscutae]|uniref:Uncharacterized protein n=1 Tax=Colletotrichum cuscutae TaxID=1209917 RepID=A0AAJ0DL21_9PEZI|nr:hypothetical protein CCUS01_14399 [Colletotrichum cuscutae]
MRLVFSAEIQCSRRILRTCLRSFRRRKHESLLNRRCFYIQLCKLSKLRLRLILDTPAVQLQCKAIEPWPYLNRFRRRSTEFLKEKIGQGSVYMYCGNPLVMQNDEVKQQLKTGCSCIPSRLGTVTLPSTADSPTFPQITLIIEGGIGLYPSRRSECNPSSATKDGPLPLIAEQSTMNHLSYGYYYSKGAYLPADSGLAVLDPRRSGNCKMQCTSSLLIRLTLDWRPMPIHTDVGPLGLACLSKSHPSIHRVSILEQLGLSAFPCFNRFPYHVALAGCLKGGPAFLDHKQPPTIFRVRRTLQGSLGHAYLLQIRSHFSGRDGWASELLIQDSHGTASVKQQRIQANVVLQPEPARPATQASSYPSTRMAFSKSTPKDQIAPSTFLPSPGSVSPLSTPDFSSCLTGIFGKLVREQVQSCLQFTGQSLSLAIIAPDMSPRNDAGTIHPADVLGPSTPLACISPDTRGPKVYAGGIRWTYSIDLKGLSI